MNRQRVTILALVAIGLTVLACQDGLLPDGSSEAKGGVSVAQVLRSSGTGDFLPITGPPALSFPRDHGPHRDQQIEWWYFTGHLDGEENQSYGYQLTFFRIGLKRKKVERRSAWAAQETWMAHFALTDISRQKFSSAERFARGALDLAGAETTPFKVWTESWSATGSPESLFPIRLKAEEDTWGIDLELTPQKPVVLQGDRGYSRKGEDPGNASGYLSFTRLTATGTVLSEGRSVPVTGTTWMDHEWSTSVLDQGIVGWDWFSLHLEDGRELMLYQLRDAEGRAAGKTAGCIVTASGAKTSLSRDEFEIRVLDHWTSPRSGTTYPSKWRLLVPTHKIELEVTPLVAAQELDVSVRYWEGAVRAVGDVSGRGYVELVGYADDGSSD